MPRRPPNSSNGRTRTASTALPGRPVPTTSAPCAAASPGPGATVLLGFDGADLIASALAAPGRADRGAGAPIPGSAHVSLIAVDPRHWGSGHGTAILDALTERLAAAGYRRLTLSVVASNVRARRLYERQGWIADGAPEPAAHGPDEPMQWYVRSLPDPPA